MHEKTEYFSYGDSNFASNFPSRQTCQNVVNRVFEKQIYIFLRVAQVVWCVCVLFFFTKITVLLETISSEMFNFIG